MSNSHFIHREQCPACGGRSLDRRYAAPYDKPPVKTYLEDFYAPQGGIEPAYLVGATYILDECQSCSLIFQRDIPNDQLMERLYEHWIDPQRALAQIREATRLDGYAGYAQEIMQWIGYFGGHSASLQFLDFGMGWGRWSLMAKAFGCASFGSEASQARIAHARTLGIEVLSWDEIPQHRFDFINTEQVFEHIAEPLATLRHLRTALKRGGVIKISVPDGHDIEHRLSRMNWNASKGTAESLNPVAPLEHINLFRRSSILEMAAAAEMQEIELPTSLRYAYAVGWRGLGSALKTTARPVLPRLLPASNVVFLRAIAR